MLGAKFETINKARTPLLEQEEPCRLKQMNKKGKKQNIMV